MPCLADMPRVDAILEHSEFKRRLALIDALEHDRVFCKHGISHLLDVARVAWMYGSREGFDLVPELVYAAALLHDLGRSEEYETGEPHDIAGVRIAREILGTVERDKRFSSDEIDAVLSAVVGHRSDGAASMPLARAIRFADKASRPCFACAAREACNWPDEKKNLTISW